MSVCPAPPAGLPKGSPQHNAALAGTILTPIFLLGAWLFFYLNRAQYVFLRKRSLLLTSLACLGVSFQWASSVLYDVVGPMNYSCALYAFFYYLATPFAGGPIMFQGHLYLSDVSAQTLALAGSPVEGEISFAAFRSHFRVALCASRNKADRLLSAKFTRTRAFWTTWLGITVGPYLIAYFIRLATEPSWNQGCIGCALTTADFACLIAINSSNLILCYLAYSFKVRKRDSLRIIRQCLMAMLGPLMMLVIIYIVSMFDPNNGYLSGQVNFASLTLIPCLLAIYVITIHQVFVAKGIKQKILFSENVDRVDRFEDIMNDKDLKAQLQQYLSSELSGEILMFLDACNEVKAKYAINKSEGEAEARLVFGLFIEKNRAIYEVNLPSAVRESVTKKIRGEFDSTVFDEAYNDVRGNFLRDGFPRFLHKLKKEPPVSKGRLTVSVLSSKADRKKSRTSPMN